MCKCVTQRNTSYPSHSPNQTYHYSTLFYFTKQPIKSKKLILPNGEGPTTFDNAAAPKNIV
jgi:hypothetical protein